MRQASLDELARNYGQRSVTLARLMMIASSLDFSVPEFVVVPVTFAHEINKQYVEMEKRQEYSSYLSLDQGRIDFYEKLIQEHVENLSVAAKIITNANPIIRGSSALEGLNSLSFAGICRTVIPRQDTPLKACLLNGVAKVLAGSFTPYADYYMSHHEVRSWGRNIGLTLMKLVEVPIIHATAYAYPDELRIRYFLNPTVGTKYAGGHEMILKRENFMTTKLPEHAQEFEKTWMHIANTMWALHDDFFGEPVPIDIEFLVEETQGKEVLQIVQMRPISRPHEKNYLQARVLSQVKKEIKGDIVIPSSHLYHSVGDVADGQVIDLRDVTDLPDFENLASNTNSYVFLISHNTGEGTFEFLRSLPKDFQVAALIITHPENRNHDHLQYSVYEDRRLNMVIHCSENIVRGISHGDIIMLQSDGNQVLIQTKRKNR